METKSFILFSLLIIISNIIVIGVLCHLIIKEHGHQYAHFHVIPGKRYRLDWQKQPSGKYRLVCEELDY